MNNSWSKIHKGADVVLEERLVCSNIAVDPKALHHHGVDVQLLSLHRRARLAVVGLDAEILERRAIFLYDLSTHDERERTKRPCCNTHVGCLWEGPRT